jgi:hypothetical protein
MYKSSRCIDVNARFHNNMSASYKDHLYHNLEMRRLTVQKYILSRFEPIHADH